MKRMWPIPFVLVIILLSVFFLRSEPAEWRKLSDLQHASHADYFFLRDKNNKEWVFKQITEPAPDDQVVTVLEIIASEMSHTVGIPLNFAKLVPANEKFSCRIFPNLPGSLHLKVPGKGAEDSLPWSGFDIHQKFRTPFQIAKNGPLPKEEIGLRKDIILNMSKHSDLAKIVAIDTFLGNSDRSNGNIFYDTETNSFYGIDMGSCLMGNLAQIAIEKISSNMHFSKEEVEGLKQYRETLLSLISHFPPEKTIALLNHCLKEAGFVSTNPVLWSEDLERKIGKWTRLVNENYNSSLELVSLLQKITENENVSYHR